MSSSHDAVLLKAIGRRIRTFRLKHGLSQEELALSAGLDRTYVGGVERGERNVSIINLQKLADALSISLSVLVDISEHE